MKYYLSSVFFFVLLMGQNAFGSEIDCSNARKTMKINKCYLQEYETQDARLNHFYKELMQMLSKADERSLTSVKGKMIEELRNAQRKWIAFRDADCSFHYSLGGGGSIAGMKNIQCKIRMTESRTEDFVRVLNDFYELGYTND